MEEKQPIRQMDPVFRELFDNAEKVELDDTRLYFISASHYLTRYTDQKTTK